MKRPAATSVDEELLRSWPLPDPDRTRSKEERGRVFVVAGSPTVPGAAILAAEASLRAGAGKLQIAVPASAATAIAVAVPEAKVLPFPTEGDDDGRMTPAMDDAARSADAVLVGVGMDDGPALRRMVERLGARSGSLVVDAGGIAAFRTLSHVPAPTVLTPHEGEMASLLGIEREDVSARPAELALEFAARAGVVVVLKGPETWIATSEGRLFRHSGGTSGLGTSGSGDVLAGILTGLVARGATPDQAAVWAVRLHALAGERLSRDVGRVGFLARQLSPLVPTLIDSI
ncbi:MAG: NAD(P)H-hydrate dehydratase [Lysobacteraceae bacterium]